MDAFVVSLPLLAVVKARPRFSRLSRRVYTPKRTEDFERELRRLTIGYIGSRPLPLFGAATPLAVELNIVLPRPSKLRRKRDPDGLLWAAGSSKDVDNFAKSILDGLNHVLWEDDRQIVDLHVRRIWNYKDQSGGMIGIFVREVAPLSMELQGIPNRVSSEEQGEEP